MPRRPGRDNRPPKFRRSRSRTGLGATLPVTPEAPAAAGPPRARSSMARIRMPAADRVDLAHHAPADHPETSHRLVGRGPRRRDGQDAAERHPREAKAMAFEPRPYRPGGFGVDLYELTPAERRGYRQGRRDARVDLMYRILEARFGPVPHEAVSKVDLLSDAALGRLALEAALSPDLEKWALKVEDELAARQARIHQRLATSSRQARQRLRRATQPGHGARAVATAKMAEDFVEILTIRFGHVPQSLVDAIGSMTSLQLDELLRAAVLSKSLDDVSEALKNVSPP